MKSPHRSRASERHARAKAFRCVCGQQVFFNNSECLNCHRQLGFDPKRGHVLALDSGKAGGLWIEAGARAAGPSGAAPITPRPRPATGCCRPRPAGRSAWPVA
ncbi:zinc-ribbon domain-containing protein [Achromobacter xylosoxidans]